jgi:polysaccharide export outer membrane protein
MGRGPVRRPKAAVKNATQKINILPAYLKTGFQTMVRASLAWRGLLLALFAVVIAGCARSAPPLPGITAGPYRLDSGDTVRVIVYNQQSLSTDYTVGDDGTISVPMVGAVKARAQTVEELQQALYNKLNDGVLVKPGVSVQLAQARPIFVIGEVNKPGQYPYIAKLNVLAAVAVAGGFTVRADHDQVTVVRSVRDKSGEWSAGPSVALQPGDVVVVHEQFF